MDEHPNELLHDDRHLPVDLAHRLVAHEEGGAGLQRGDLEREVEGRDDGDATKGHPDPVRRLAGVVARDAKGAREHPHIVARVVLHPLARDGGLAEALRPRLGHHPLDQITKVLQHLRLPQLLGALRHHVTEHRVPLGVLDWVVQPRARAILHAGDVVVHLCLGGVGYFHHRAATQRILKLEQTLRIAVPRFPHAPNQIHADGRIGCRHLGRISRRP
mmetsp:Transcript_34098/g.109529  ORF Transcript_34098/g.109529 Transcript_34098/m.109529 type:complete len:217 (+) Transcript_34098:1205-1855(+)